MDGETNDLLARLYLSEKNLEQVEPREFAEWADLEMGRGHDLESLRRLAAAARNEEMSVVEQRFRECVAELGWELPKKKEVMKRHAESTLQSIVDGKIEPYYGCSHLYIISIFLGHPDNLYAWDEIFWAREDLPIEEMNEVVMKEARRALGLEPPETFEDEDDLFDEDEERTFWTRLKELLGFR